MKIFIDVTPSDYIPLKEVPNHLPKRNGKKIHYSTVYRWVNKGVRGQKLEAKPIGGILYTTSGALLKFCLEQGTHPEQAKVDDAIECILRGP